MKDKHYVLVVNKITSKIDETKQFEVEWILYVI
jgi:hypothetical protein